VARNQPTVLAHQRWRRPAPLLDARGYRGDMGIRVGPCIFRVRDQPIDRPPFDLVRRPRSLISDSLSRAGARTRDGGEVLAPRDGGEVLALLPAGRPAPGRAPPRAIDCFLRLNLFKAPTESPLIDGSGSVDNLAYLYLDLAAELGLENAVLVGACFGGWVAAEMMVRSTARFRGAMPSVAW
jgi:hypothetical protein